MSGIGSDINAHDAPVGGQPDGLPHGLLVRREEKPLELGDRPPILEEQVVALENEPAQGLLPLMRKEANALGNAGQGPAKSLHQAHAP